MVFRNRRRTTGRTDRATGAPVTIRGLVIPAAWDADGKVTAVAISAFDDTEYQVKAGPLANELIGHLRGEIEAVGRVSSAGKGAWSILLESFRPIGRESAGLSKGV